MQLAVHLNLHQPNGTHRLCLTGRQQCGHLLLIEALLDGLGCINGATLLHTDERQPSSTWAAVDTTAALSCMYFVH